MPPNPQKTGTGFVGLQQYLDANQPAVQSTASNLAGQDSAAADHAAGGAALLGFEHRANKSADPTTLAGYAQARGNLQDAAANLGGSAISKGDTPDDQGLDSFGGLQQQLDKNYGNTSTPYSAGDRNLDATLLSSDSGAQGQFKAAQDHFAGLDNYLDKATAGSGPSGFGNGFKDGRTPAAPAPTLNDPGYNGPHKASAGSWTSNKPVYDTENESGITHGIVRKGGDTIDGVSGDSYGGSGDSYGGSGGQYGGSGGNSTNTDDRGNPGVTVRDPNTGDKTGFIPDPKPTTQDGGVTVTDSDGVQTGYIPASDPTVTLDPSQQEPTFWDHVKGAAGGFFDHTPIGGAINGWRGKK